MSTPCFNCPNRSAGCHAVCDDYKAYEAKRKEIRIANLAAYELERAIRIIADANNRKYTKLV